MLGEPFVRPERHQGFPVRVAGPETVQVGLDGGSCRVGVVERFRRVEHVPSFLDADDDRVADQSFYDAARVRGIELDERPRRPDDDRAPVPPHVHFVALAGSLDLHDHLLVPLPLDAGVFQTLDRDIHFVGRVNYHGTVTSNFWMIQSLDLAYCGGTFLGDHSRG